MIKRVALPDVNVLFAAHVADHVDHRCALKWLRNTQAFATCPTTEQGLIRLLSNPAANPGASIGDALAALARVRTRHEHVQWHDDTSLDNPLIDLTRLTGHRQVTDFHLLNLAVRYGGVLVTMDEKIERGLPRADQQFVYTLRNTPPHL